MSTTRIVQTPAIAMGLTLEEGRILRDMIIAYAPQTDHHREVKEDLTYNLSKIIAAIQEHQENRDESDCR